MARETKLSDIRAWHSSLNELRSSKRCSGPGFFLPYHFVTMALLLKEEHVGELFLPENVTEYAARLKLWEAIGLSSPIQPHSKPGGSRYHELTRLTDLAAVANVADALTTMVLGIPGKSEKDNWDSLFITLTELLGNCHHHARSADDLHGLVCAQTWYQESRAQFAIADSGIGIRASLAENADLSSRLESQNACSLATELGISSKLFKGHAGYGLAVARDLALQTPGAMLFVQSCSEAVMIENGKITEISDFKHALPGTLVLFEWDMNQDLNVTKVYASWPSARDDDDDFF